MRHKLLILLFIILLINNNIGFHFTYFVFTLFIRYYRFAFAVKLSEKCVQEKDAQGLIFYNILIH